MARKSKFQRDLEELEKELDDPELPEDFRQDVREIVEEMRRMDEETTRMSRAISGKGKNTPEPQDSYLKKVLFCRHIFNVVKPKARAKEFLLSLDEDYEPFIKIFYRR